MATTFKDYENGDILYAADMNSITNAINAAEENIAVAQTNIHTHSNKDVLDGITAEDITKLDSLSNYDDTEIKADIAALETEIENKVDAVSGKGLSSNDYTDADKTSVTASAELLAEVTELASGGGGGGTALTPVWTPPKNGNITGTAYSNPDDSADLRNWCLIFYDKFPTEVQFDAVDLPVYTSDTTHPVKVEANVVDDSLITFNTPYVNLPHTYTATVSGDDINTSQSGNLRAEFSQAITVPVGKCLVFAIYQGEDPATQSSIYKTLNFRYTIDNQDYTNTTADFVLDEAGEQYTKTAIHTTTADACLKKLWQRADATMNVWSMTILWNENAYSPGFILYKETEVPAGDRLLKWEALNGGLPASKVTDNSIGDSKITDERPSGLYLPSKLYGVTGTELNVYYDSIIPDRRLSHYFRVEGDNGVALDECWRADTTGAATKTLRFSVYNPRFEQEYSQEVALKVKADTINGDTKTLVVGDSIIANGSHNGMITYALQQKNSHIVTIGTQGAEGNRHEGRPGWTLANFVSAGSPFYIGGKVDFGAYMTNNGFSGCAIVLFQLGINDVLSLNAYTTVGQLVQNNIGYYDTLIASIHEYDPDIKVGICTTSAIPASESLSLSYPGEGFSTWKFKQQLHEYGMGIMEEYAGREDENIFIVPFRNNIDPDDHFPAVTEDKNAHSDTQVKRQNNLHPTDDGYSALADALYAFVVNNS